MEESAMPFKTLFLAHAPDADKEKHRCSIETSLYRLYVVVVKDQKEALEISKEFFREKNIESILLCPGFTHGDVAEIFKALDNKVSVCVARGDGPSGRISADAMNRAGFFAHKEKK
jgi:hypothetical protein